MRDLPWFLPAWVCGWWTRLVRLIDVTYDESVGDDALRRPLADALTDAVAAEVDCPEEPLIGPPGPGDIETRFRPKGPADVGDLALVVEGADEALREPSDRQGTPGRFSFETGWRTSTSARSASG